jgi:hypothetical protein
MHLTTYPAPVAARLSARVTATLSFDDGGLSVTWDPQMPDRLSDAELGRYRSARHTLLEEMARMNDLELVILGGDAFGFGRRSAA